MTEGADVVQRQHDAATPGIDLLVRNVDVSIGGNSVLKKVSCFAKRGELLAIMGSSGAGKSTLLSSIAGRLEVACGKICINGTSMNKQLRRVIGYVLQQDCFFSSLTLRQTLQFHAEVRLSMGLTRKEKQQRIYDVVTQLRLEHCLDTKMGGDWEGGLSGGERKRASIACEMLTEPALLLTDEPTSGLDVVSASAIMGLLMTCAHTRGQTILATIHQPSSQVFHMFDRVLLLDRGQVAYFGKADEMLAFFEEQGFPCSTGYNPADFALEKLISNEAHSKLIRASEKQKYSEDWMMVMSRHGIIDEVEQPRRRSVIENDGVTIVSPSDCTASEEVSLDITTHNHKGDRLKSVSGKWPSSMSTQYKALYLRNFHQTRIKMMTKLKWLFTIFLSIFGGLLWFQLERSESTMNDRTGILFFSIQLWAFFVTNYVAIDVILDKGIVIHRERASGLYRLSVYYVTKVVTTAMFLSLHIAVFTVPLYWMTSLHRSASVFVLHLALVIFTNLSFQAVGTFVGCLLDDVNASLTVANLFMISTMVAGGFYQKHYPSWLRWIRWLSHVNHAFQALIYTEFYIGDELECSSPNITVFSECRTNTSLLIQKSSVLSHLDVSLPLGVYIGVSGAMTALFYLLGYLVLRYLKSPVIDD